MFNLEVLIGVADLDSPVAMQTNRDTLDAGAKTYHAHPRFLREEVAPYRVRTRASGAVGAAGLEYRAETEETKKYRILRRWYE